MRAGGVIDVGGDRAGEGLADVEGSFGGVLAGVGDEVGFAEVPGEIVVEGVGGSGEEGVCADVDGGAEGDGGF